MKPPNVIGIAKALNDAGVIWVAIGGVAMILHGSDYVTTDLDFAVAHDSSNAEKLAEAMRKIHAKPKRWQGTGEFVLDPKLLSAPFLELESDFGSIHILNRLPGVENFQDLASRATRIPVNGTSVPVASLEDLILMKASSNRPKDKIHLLELEALQKLRGA